MSGRLNTLEYQMKFSNPYERSNRTSKVTHEVVVAMAIVSEAIQVEATEVEGRVEVEEVEAGVVVGTR